MPRFRYPEEFYRIALSHPHANLLPTAVKAIVEASRLPQEIRDRQTLEAWKLLLALPLDQTQAAQIDFRDQNGIPLINYAIAAKDRRLFNFLREKGCPLVSPIEIEEAQTELRRFASQPSAQPSSVGHFLRVPGVDANALCDDAPNALPHRTPSLLWKAVNSGNIDMVEALTQIPGLDGNAIHADCTPLWNAIRQENLEMVKALLKVPNVQLTARSSIQKSPLAFAVSKNNFPIFKALYAAQGNRSEESQDLLFDATSLGNLPILNALLRDPSVDVNRYNETKKCRLFSFALAQRDINIINRLLKVKALNLDYREYDQSGRTPLHQAVVLNMPKVVSALLQRPDVDPQAVTHWRETPLDLAKDRAPDEQEAQDGEDEMVRLLESHAWKQSWLSSVSKQVSRWFGCCGQGS